MAVVAQSGVASLRHMSICAWVVVAVTFKQIDCAPDTEARAERDHERLEDAYCGLEKCHIDWEPEIAGFMQRTKLDETRR